VPSTDNRLARLERRAEKFERRAEKLESRVVELEAEVAARDERIDELEAKNAKLEAENAKLRGEASQNSRNSGKPPSSDSPKQRAERKKRKKKRGSGRRRGAQPGHKGHQRQLLPPDKVTRTRERFPKRCACCRDPLPKVPHGDPIRHQTVEVPKLEPDVTEDRLHAVECPRCETLTRARLPHNVPRGMCGPNLMALITLMVGVYHLSRRQTVSFLGDVLGVRISLGCVSKTEGRVADMLAPAHSEAAAIVGRARAKHADATGWRQSGTPRTLWVIASKLATVFHIVADGTQARFQELIRTLGILITDRGSQFGFWALERRQVCWAHLARKFVAFSEHDDPHAAELGRALVLLTEVMFGAWHKVRDGTMSRHEFRNFADQVRVYVEAHLRRGVELRLAGVSGSCKHLLKHADAMWTFARVPGVEPTNNHAEREFRRFIIWRKTSFGSQSDRGDRFAERIMTVVHTLRKHDRHVLTFLRDTIEASMRGEPTPSLISATP
jgi:transposase